MATVTHIQDSERHEITTGTRCRIITDVTEMIKEYFKNFPLG